MGKEKKGEGKVSDNSEERKKVFQLFFTPIKYKKMVNYP